MKGRRRLLSLPRGRNVKRIRFHPYLKYIAYFERESCVICIIYTVNLQQICFTTSLKGTDTFEFLNLLLFSFLVLFSNDQFGTCLSNCVALHDRMQIYRKVWRSFKSCPRIMIAKRCIIMGLSRDRRQCPLRVHRVGRILI